MLSLDSARWAELTDAFGSGSDVPGLLRKLGDAPIKAGWKAEPWHELWSRLCHQGDVYSASFAAVPHIVEAASSRPPTEQAEYLVLAGSIEECRSRGVDVPEDLETSYRDAMHQAAELAARAIPYERDPAWRDGLQDALAQLKAGWRALGPGA